MSEVVIPSWKSTKHNSHDRTWHTHNGPKLQAAKGRQLRVVLQSSCFIFTWEMEHSLFEICRIISNPGYYTSKNHLEPWAFPSGTGASPSIFLSWHPRKLGHQPSNAAFLLLSIPWELYFSRPKRRSLEGRNFRWQNTHTHTSQKRTTSVISVVCFVNKVEQACPHELPTTIPWWRLGRKKPKSNISIATS